MAGVNGDARVPTSYRADGFKLGVWVAVQRVKYLKGRLEADRKRRFEELPGWTWDRQADKWEAGFSPLLGYVQRNGDARVPQRSYTVDGFKLGA